jgi:hypothetical protein
MSCPVRGTETLAIPTAFERADVIPSEGPTVFSLAPVFGAVGPKFEGSAVGFTGAPSIALFEAVKKPPNSSKSSLENQTRLGMLGA